MAERAEALVLTEPRQLHTREFELPSVGLDDGVLRIEACGLCGTDHEQYTGHIRADYAFIPGHEVVGIVEQLGERAAERWGVQVGDRVAVEVFMSCRSCEQCLSGAYRRCVRHGIRHMYGFVDTELAPGLWGGYATHLYLHPDSMLLPVPASLDPAVATAFNPLGAGIRWGATLPDVSEGDVVAVLGPGIRGLSAAAAAKEAGAGFVAITGLGPNDLPRLEIASRFGADLAIDVAEQNPAAAIKEATGGLADVIVDVTAKAPAALAQAVSMARPGGMIVMAGTRGSDATPGFHPDHIVYKELRLEGALGVDFPAYQRALEILESGRYPFEELPRQTVGLDDLEGLIQTMAGEGAADIPIHGVLVPEP